eukprot:2702260-Amphidinium_carterae.2
MVPNSDMCGLIDEDDDMQKITIKHQQHWDTGRSLMQGRRSLCSLLYAKDTLHNRVIGQNEAVTAVSKARGLLTYAARLAVLAYLSGGKHCLYNCNCAHNHATCFRNEHKEEAARELLLAQAVRRARAGLKNPNRPIASFIFCGPTGHTCSRDGSRSSKVPMS